MGNCCQSFLVTIMDPGVCAVYRAIIPLRISLCPVTLGAWRALFIPQFPFQHSCRLQGQNTSYTPVVFLNVTVGSLSTFFGYCCCSKSPHDELQEAKWYSPLPQLLSGLSAVLEMVPASHWSSLSLLSWSRSAPTPQSLLPYHSRHGTCTQKVAIKRLSWVASQHV